MTLLLENWLYTVSNYCFPIVGTEHCSVPAKHAKGLLGTGITTC